MSACRCSHDESRHVPGWNHCTDCGCESFAAAGPLVTTLGVELKRAFLRLRHEPHVQAWEKIAAVAREVIAEESGHAYLVADATRSLRAENTRLAGALSAIRLEAVLLNTTVVWNEAGQRALNEILRLSALDGAA